MKTWLAHSLCFALLALLAGGCSRLDRKDLPAPADTTALNALTLTADTTAAVYFTLDPAISTGSTLRITFGPLLHGRIVTEAARLGYELTDTSHTWVKDSTYYEACRTDVNACRRGVFVVRNPRYRKPDSAGPGPAPACRTLVLPLLDVGTSTAAIRLAPSGAGPGRIDSVKHSWYQVSIRASDSLVLEYTPFGGNQDIYAGYDEVQFWSHTADSSYCGVVEVSIGDPCQARARPDTVARGSLPPYFIPYSQLVLNDKGCGGQLETYALRLQGIPYTGRKTLPTLYGTISDTTINGQAGFYYRKTVITSQPDVFIYYAQGASDDFVTRAKVIIYN